ncbi:phosphatase PAP2 family protein [Clostridium sp. AM58-1XD]|uniref:phosphatase PAP2 family protein n=1 Tax=Clostridium sp. AM58-1XD TaxID=2292307 RepID=UPI000E53D567|nr:phosphatase PAP2 family protein [Clostridium sp. AM58-1XD]RGY98427.1 phosphoesterase [Clostridium sp. AM58-1XD]
MKQFLAKYKHAWVLLYGFIYLPWFSYLERTVTKNYHIMHVSMDDYIPFNEYFIIPYLIWFFYVSGAILYFFFQEKGSYYRLCFFLFTGMTISLIICTIFPNGTDFRPMIDPDKNVFSWIVSALYRTDTCTNVFPSIHVYNSIGVHIAVMHSERLKNHHWLRIGSFIAMTSICLSTVFLKQHSVIDGFASIAMAYCLYGMTYGKAYGYSRRKAAEKALG